MPAAPALVFALAAAAAGPGSAPIPDEPPIGGPLWTIVVPALVFAVSLVATYLLYRRFADE